GLLLRRRLLPRSFALAVRRRNRRPLPRFSGPDALRRRKALIQTIYAGRGWSVAGGLGVIFAGQARYAVLGLRFAPPCARHVRALGSSLASPAKARASAPRRRRKRLRDHPLTIATDPAARVPSASEGAKAADA